MAEKAPENISFGRADAYYRQRAELYHEQTKDTQEQLTKVAGWHLERRVQQQIASSDGIAKGRQSLSVPVTLELGCGSGLSTKCFQEQISPQSYMIGLDRSSEMLRINDKTRRREERVLCDCFGAVLPFRDGVADQILSISALQWLFAVGTTNEGNVNRDDKNEIVGDSEPSPKRQKQSPSNQSRGSTDQIDPRAVAVEATKPDPIERFFVDAARVGACGIYQFYPVPGSPGCIDVLVKAARKAGGHAEAFMHFPHKQAKKKYYLWHDAQSANSAIASPDTIPELQSQKKQPAADQSEPWCALCWPWCGAACTESLMNTGKEATDGSMSAEQKQPDNAYHVQRSRKEHLSLFTRYMRNMVRLVSVSGSGTREELEVANRILSEIGPVGVAVGWHIFETLFAKKRVADQSKAQAQNAPSIEDEKATIRRIVRSMVQERKEQTEKYVDVSGTAPACDDLAGSGATGANAIKVGEWPKAAATVNEGKAGNAKAPVPSIPTAKELMTFITDDEEKIQFLHVCPWKELRHAPTHQIRAPTLEQYLDTLQAP
ncbi:unnamed protein product [Amoebophrya sp. A120]|nr:unnamed protein product [Amoebophrya sp. A120]|eukprot:GSA120T00004998001.1